ncbi:ABC transporter substrate-binding protein [Burkholderia multivorans]|uniref:ABC transporter substrate-binding protein n=1 Tax=Burkholderia multivorans TaxID=87883 RepID=UPI001C960E77|nr:ABC transporter substrate-binding protein [Burkholderia multivorans]MBY4674343.1 ABC transporter substrate-binding protein [Burkholderia multivorans]
MDESRILRVALDWEVAGIDPPRAGGGWNTGRVVQHTHESLVEDDFDTPPGTPDAPTLVIPWLAETVEVSPDMQRFVFRLRPGVHFHDGAVLDAEAVVMNYARICDVQSPFYSPVAADLNRPGVEAIAQVKALDPMTVEFLHRVPFPDFLRYMTQQDAPGAQSLVSPNALRSLGPDGCTDLAPGTGPFCFHRRFDTEGGSAVELSANEDYWQGRPWLSGIRFLPFPDLGDRVRALTEGTVDIAYSLEGADLDDLAARGFQVPAFSPPYLWYLVFNLRDPVMADVRVRRAIAHAIDRNALSESLFPGATLPARSALPPGSPAYDVDAVEHYPYDPARARSLLKEAGLGGGIVLKSIAALAGSAQLDPVAIQTRIAEDLARIGIRLETEFHHDWLGYFNGWREGASPGVSISEMSWGMSSDLWLYQILHSRNRSPTGFNAGYVADSMLDDLLDRARSEVNSARRIRQYRAADARVMETLPILPLLSSRRGMLAFSHRVEGLTVVNQCWQDFRRVRLSR